MHIAVLLRIRECEVDLFAAFAVHEVGCRAEFLCDCQQLIMQTGREHLLLGNVIRCGDQRKKICLVFLIAEPEHFEVMNKRLCLTGLFILAFHVEVHLPVDDDGIAQSRPAGFAGLPE